MEGYGYPPGRPGGAESDGNISGALECEQPYVRRPGALSGHFPQRPGGGVGVPADIRREAMLVYATIQNDTKPYDPNVQTVFSKSFINFSAFADEKWLEQFTDSEESDVELNFNE